MSGIWFSDVGWAEAADPPVGIDHHRPTTRSGVSPSQLVLPNNPAARLPSTILEYLSGRFTHIGADVWQQRMLQGAVTDERGHPIRPATPFEPGLRIYYFRDLPQETRIPFDAVVVYRDEHLVVVDKPHFLPVMPSGKYLQETVLVRLKNELGLDDLVPIHRIDRDTAGLVLFSVNRRSRDAYHALFRERQVDKTYHAIAPWNPDLAWPIRRATRIGASGHFMQQTEKPGEPNAITDIRPLAVWGSRALYELKPVSGQRHQLRVHMNALGLPILNDGIYPELTPEGTPDPAQPLQLLAQRIAFVDPLSLQPCEFVSARQLHLGTMNSDTPA